MKIFYDTEFTGLHKDTSLISIGLVADNGKGFYGVVTDYDKTQLNDWLKENVIQHLYINKSEHEANIEYHYDTKEKISKDLNKWLSQFNTIEWVSDVCHYDFVLLIDLIYGQALNIPYNKNSSVCYDINQDIAKLFEVSDIEAFNMSREHIVSMFYDESVKGNKHNALYNAKVIKAIYEIIL